MFIRHDKFNQVAAARTAIVRELIRRVAIERPVAPRKIDSMAYTNTVLPLIIEYLEREKA
jgi:hypothetical protein